MTKAGAPKPGPDEEVLRAPMAGIVVDVQPDTVVLEAMKMQHVLAAPVGAGSVSALVSPGQTVGVGDAVLTFTRAGVAGVNASVAELAPDSPPCQLGEPEVGFR